MSLLAKGTRARLLFLISVFQYLFYSCSIMTSYVRKPAIASPVKKAMVSPTIAFDIVFLPTLSGMASIKVRATHFRKAILFDTDVSVFPEDWNKARCAVRSTHPRYKELNARIRKIIYDLEGFVIDHEDDCSLSMLRRAWDERLITTDWYEMFESKIEHRNITPSTRAIHRNLLRKLRIYSPSCDTNELTDDFFEGYINSQRGRVCDATLEKVIQILKCYYHIAKELYGDRVPHCTFDWYAKPAASQKNFRIKALGESDIKKIECWVMKSDIKPKWKRDMHRFLFMSYTGMRVSDFNNCDEAKISVESGVTWLTYTSIKTHTYTRVPISTVFDGRAVQILTAYENDLASFFHIGDRCHFNERIKAICKTKIGIEQKVTTHCGRHTFATRLVNKEVPITTIAKVCGHNNIKTTMIYANTTEDAMIRQLSC